MTPETPREGIGSDVVENPEQADQGINLPYDYGVARRAGANNLHSEMQAKRKEMGL